MNASEMRQRLAEVTDEMQDLVDSDLDDEARAAFDTLEAEAKTLQTDIDRLESLQARQQTVNAPAPKPKVSSLVMGDAPQDRKFGSMAENFRAIINASIPGGSVDPRLRRADVDPDARVLGGIDKRATGLSEGAGAYGGFFLETEHADDLLDPMFQTGILTPRVKQYTISNAAANSVTFQVLDETDRGRGNRLGGLRLYTREEASTVTASKPKWYEWEVKPKSVMALCYFTNEQLEDTPAIVNLVQSYFQNEAGYEIDEYILNGDGASEPLGITKHDCLITVAKETGQTASTIVTENLINMYARMPERFRRNAIWTYPANALPQLLTLRLDLGVSSVPVWLPGNTISGAPFNSVFNRPIVELEQAPSVGTANDVMFIDPSQYMLVRKGGARTDLSMHVQFLYGEVVLRFMFRIGGGSWWKSAITPANDGDTLGPFIGLAVRS